MGDTRGSNKQRIQNIVTYDTNKKKIEEKRKQTFAINKVANANKPIL